MNKLALALPLSLAGWLAPALAAAQAPPPPPPEAPPPPPPAIAPAGPPPMVVHTPGAFPPPPPPPEFVPAPPPRTVAERPAWGGLGYASVGMMLGQLSGFENTLGKDSALGRGYAPADGALTFGGGGGMLLGARFWLGGGGFGSVIGTSPSPVANVELTGGGGGFEFGYAAYNASSWLVIPYFGLGGFGYTVAVTNVSGATLHPYTGSSIATGEKVEYNSGFFTGEIGVRVFRLLFPGRGGFAVGADIGYRASLTRDPWRGPDKANVGQESASMSAAYFRLTLGGGGFFWEHAPEP